MYNRRILLTRKADDLVMKRAKKKMDKINQRYTLHHKKYLDRKDKKANHQVSLRFVDRTFVMNA